METSCHHSFHGHCLYTWFSHGHDTCPCCRSSLPQEAAPFLPEAPLPSTADPMWVDTASPGVNPLYAPLPDDPSVPDPLLEPPRPQAGPSTSSSADPLPSPPPPPARRFSGRVRRAPPPLSQSLSPERADAPSWRPPAALAPSPPSTMATPPSIRATAAAAVATTPHLKRGRDPGEPEHRASLRVRRQPQDWWTASPAPAVVSDCSLPTVSPPLPAVAPDHFTLAPGSARPRTRRNACTRGAPRGSQA